MSDTKPDALAVMPSGRVVRYRTDQVGNNLDAHLAWCDTHNEPIWVFGDGSFTCPHDLVVGGTTLPHLIVTAPWERVV